MGAFSGGIAATAALQQITTAINGVKAFGEGLKNVETSLATVTEKSLFSSDATQKRAEQLKKFNKNFLSIIRLVFNCIMICFINIITHKL